MNRCRSLIAALAFVLATGPLHAQKIQLRLEVILLPRELAVAIQQEAGDDHEALHAACRKGGGAIVAAPVILSRSGQRARVTTGGPATITTGYEEREGKDVRTEKEVFVGTSFETDPVLGADGVTLEVNLRGSHSLDPRKTSRKLLMTSGKTEEIEVGVEQKAEVITSVTLAAGSRLMVGSTPHPEKADASLLFFLHADLVE